MIYSRGTADFPGRKTSPPAYPSGLSRFIKSKAINRITAGKTQCQWLDKNPISREPHAEQRRHKTSFLSYERRDVLFHAAEFIACAADSYDISGFVASLISFLMAFPAHVGLIPLLVGVSFVFRCRSIRRPFRLSQLLLLPQRTPPSFY
jgi:hypothetical protein